MHATLRKIARLLLGDRLYRILSAIRAGLLDAHNDRAGDGRRAALYKSWIKPGDLVFDIGANIGNRTRVFAALGARVVAVEPQPHCYWALRWLLKFNSRVTLIRAAASFDNSSKVFMQRETHVLSSMRDRRFQVVESNSDIHWARVEYTVPCVTLDELVVQYGAPVFTKIDVEGYEPEVLRGLTKPAGTLSFEVVPRLQEHIDECLTWLEAIGYRHFQFSLNESMQLPDGWLDAAAIRACLSRFATSKTDFGDVYARDPAL